MVMERKQERLSDQNGGEGEVETEGREEMAHFGYRRVPASEKPSWVRRHFNSIAGKYDFMNTLLSFGIHYLWKRKAMKMLELSSGDWVIDVCGGTGDLSTLAAKAVGPSGGAILYDINRAMMEVGRLKVAQSPGAKRIIFVQGDAERISFPDRSFEAACVGFGIRNLTYIEKGFKEMHRVLKPGGKLMCLEFSQPPAQWFRWLYDFYSFHIMPHLGAFLAGSKQAYTYLPESIKLFPPADELKAILEKVGFSRVTYRRLTNGIAVIHLGVRE